MVFGSASTGRVGRTTHGTRGDTRERELIDPRPRLPDMRGRRGATREADRLARDQRIPPGALLTGGLGKAIKYLKGTQKAPRPAPETDGYSR